ncbi:AP-3 complex subunit sigma-like isoform X2 [Impatiens glandulifera]|uniref:AP-3 complex subunit sigma-like isoform X2 n=1 Tax=Impatiens glandulifera TaxID=253017 RepID=UPI001FB139B3|nr:AP-3 complex subunit sigma-like isoform X2 [Impatiens glandulifera]
MIKAVMVMNSIGKPRLTKFYAYQPAERQQEFVRCVYSVLCNRSDNTSNFVGGMESLFGPDNRLVYKHFATLYIAIVFDGSENELAMLDLIQETLDKCFKNVCELDIVVNYTKVQSILDEIIYGGQVIDTNCMEVLRAVEEISRLESESTTSKLVPRWVR